jgi:AraC-like DNA-binding protein
VHQVIENERSEGYSIAFSSEFLAANNIPVSFIHNLNLFRDYGETPPLEPSAGQMQQLTNYCEELLNFYHSEIAFQQRAISSVLELFLICCNNICSIPGNTQQAEAGNTTLKEFKRLVDEHFQTEHGTTFYANELHITPDHLNRTVKALIDKTAKEYIQSRITIAAKRMLLFTELSNKEIGYELGFSEPANFSAFFKKCSGLSPSQFRDSQLK